MSTEEKQIKILIKKIMELCFDNVDNSELHKEIISIENKYKKQKNYSSLKTQAEELIQITELFYLDIDADTQIEIDDAYSEILDL